MEEKEEEVDGTTGWQPAGDGVGVIAMLVLLPNA